MTDRVTGQTDPDAAPRVAPWNDPFWRGVIFQVVTLLVILWVGFFFAQNMAHNLARNNIASGYGFLSHTAGFGINFKLIGYSEESSYGRALLVGVLNTLLCAVLGIILATVIGFVIGIARLSPNWIVSRLAAAYIEIIRNVPLLLQIFFWYFGVLRALPSPRNSVDIGGALFINNRGLISASPIFESGSGAMFVALGVALVGGGVLSRWNRRRQERTGERFPVFRATVGAAILLPLIAYFLTGRPVSFDVPELAGLNFRGGVTIIPELVALTLALSIYTASFIAEVVRAGILAVSHGQTEASYSLGCRPGVTLRLVVIPQAMRVIIPPLTSQYLNLTKNSSLAAAIAYPELVSMFAGTVLNQTGQAVEVLSITMAIYLSLSIITAIVMNWYNARVALTER